MSDSTTPKIESQDLFDQWDSAAIQARQEMLAKLARKVWDMPECSQGVDQ